MAISYTAATGKRPKRCDDGHYYWFGLGYSPVIRGEAFAISARILVRLEGGKGGSLFISFPTEAAALAAADAAYLRAVADGAMGPIEGVA